MIYTSPRLPVENDVLVMYLIVRESLNMSVGKIAPQCGHAVDLIRDQKEYLDSRLGQLNDLELAVLTRYKLWKNHTINGGFRKVALRASDKEWEYLKENYSPIIVVDAGLTEVPPNSETVMVLWPMYKDERCKVLKRLRCL